MKNERTVKNEPKDAFDTLAPINNLLKIFFLRTLSRKNGRFKTLSRRKRMFMIATVITATLLLFVPKVICYLDDDGNRKTLRFTHALFISCLIKLVQYFVDLHYVFKSGNTSIKYFKIYEQIDDVLGMMYNSVIKSKVLTETVAVCSLVIVTLVVNFVTWSAIDGYAVHAVHTIDYILIFINTLTVIEICSNVIQVEYRLKTIGDILQDFYSSVYSLPVANLVLDKNWLYYSKDKSSERRHIDQSKFLETNHFNDLIWLNKCYMLLIRQTEYINETFGARVSKNWRIGKKYFNGY